MKYKLFMFSSFVCTTLLYADTNISNTVERGIHFGEFNKLDVNNTKDETVDILKKLLAESKKQTKLQEEIRDILKNEFEPQPKMITINGKECIENSSAECFKVPILNKDAQKIPVMKDYIQNPTQENAAKYMQWQAKLIENTLNVGYSMQFALSQHGTKAYPLDYQSGYFDTPTGEYQNILSKTNERVLNELNFELDIYLGKNPDLDLTSIEMIGKIIKSLGTDKVRIIFYSNEMKKLFDEASIYSTISDLYKNIKSIVDKDKFEKFNAYTTPAYIMIYTDKDGKKKSQTISVGRISENDLNSKLIQFANYKQLIKREDFVSYKNWSEDGNYTEDYFNHFYGIKFNDKLLKGAKDAINK